MLATPPVVNTPSVTLVSASLNLLVLRKLRGAIIARRLQNHSGDSNGDTSQSRAGAERQRPKRRPATQAATHFAGLAPRVGDAPWNCAAACDGPLPPLWAAAWRGYPWNRPVQATPAPIKIPSQTTEVDGAGRMLDQFA